MDADSNNKQISPTQIENIGFIERIIRMYIHDT